MNLIAKVYKDGELDEKFYLIVEGSFYNFDHLHELTGKDYHSVNDDLLDGDYTPYVKYDNMEELYRIEFEEECEECREEIEEIAKEIRESQEWDFDILPKFCELAGLEKAWDEADCESFENVVKTAALYLAVELW